MNCAELATGIEGQKKALYQYLKLVVLYADVHREYVYALKKAITILEKVGGYDKRVTVLRKELAKAQRER